jgi:hypothetical protein
VPGVSGTAQPIRSRLLHNKINRTTADGGSRQLLAEWSRRGEFVKSAASQSEAPVVRAIRQEFGVVGEVPDADAGAEGRGTSPSSTPTSTSQILGAAQLFLDML